jgi:hypothetical protein
MPYTLKQKRFFHANEGKKGITPAMVAEADASPTLSPKRGASKKAHPAKRRGR